MSDTTIEWTHYPRPDGTRMPGYSFNGWWGCVEAGPECDNCYARTFSHRLGLELWGATAPRRFFEDKHWNEPVKWNRKAAAVGEKHLVFLQSMSDVLEDRRDLDEKRERLWALIEATPNLIWLLLTKRPTKYATLTPERWRRDGWPDNVWAGTTAGTQRTWNVNVNALVEAARGARIRWVSVEPLLELVTGRAHLALCDRALVAPDGDYDEAAHGSAIESGAFAHPDAWALHWIVVGSESGTKARPTKIEWIRSLAVECDKYAVPLFVKQVATAEGRAAGDAKGRYPMHWPADVRRRQFPKVS